MKDFKTLSAAAIARGVQSREISAEEVTRESLRLAESEGAELNAFITLCTEKAIGQARAVDARIKRGEQVGPLAGVPVAIKDNICYRDYPTTCGSKILAQFNSPYDATAAKRLIEAGAVIIGKTNLDEFAMGSSNENSAFGPVKNPVNHELVPGGSSGGSAAAVAQGIVPIAYGSETGGSVRQPASFCGLFGLKPSYGAISRYGLVAFGSSLDQISPFARTIDDCALAYTVIAGHDTSDATSVRLRPSAHEGQGAKRTFRIGVPREYFADGLDPAVGAIVRSVKDRLEKLGHTFVDVSLSLTNAAIAVYYIVASAEASANLARFDGVKYGYRTKRLDGLESLYARTRTEGFGAEVKRRIMLGTYVLSSGYYDAYYTKATRVRELMRAEFVRTFQQVDLLISPTSPTGAFKRGEKLTDPLAMYLSDVYTAPASLVGIPALSAPGGTLADGRPVGVQFVAPYLGEDRLFAIARALRDER